MATLSLREAARRLTDQGHKVSHVALHQQIKRGAIRAEPDGSLDWQKLLGSEWMRSRLARTGHPAPIPISIPIPTASLEQSTPDRSSPAAAVPEQTCAAPSRPPIQATLDEFAEGPDPGPADPSDMQAVLARSKVDIEKLKLAEDWRRKRLDNDEREKSLVRASEVESSVESRFRDEASALLNWPSTVSKRIAADLGVDDQLMLVTLESYVREYMQERSSVPVLAAARAA